MVYTIFDKKNRIRGEKNVNKVLAQESYKPVVENKKKKISMRGIKIIFRLHIYVTWHQYLLIVVVLNIYCVP